jgi:outer membrane protein OmpA-like peptidoglycan-associated protein
MSDMRKLIRYSCALALGAAFLALPIAGRAETPQDELVDVGSQILDAQTIREGLYPNEECEAIRASGYVCAGIKPAKRFALPAAAFKFGSAELPELLRQQLDAFAEVLRGKHDQSQVIRIEGHTDAVGSAEANLSLSKRRAESVKAYLVGRGVNADLLESVGVGAERLKVASDPKAPENRRVEIGRQS